MAKPFTALQWSYIEQLARQAKRSYERYRDENGPFFCSPSERRLAREAERTLRAEANKSLRTDGVQGLDGGKHG